MKRILIYLALSILAFSSCQKEPEDTIYYEGSSDSLRFSIESTTNHNLQLKSNASGRSYSMNCGKLVLNVTEMAPTSSDDYAILTKGAPIENETVFKDSIQYMKVWGVNNGQWLKNYVSKMDTPQLLKKNNSFYIPVNSEDEFKTFTISNVDWKNPAFFAIAPASPCGTASFSDAGASFLRYNYTMPAPNTEVNNDAVNQNDWLIGYFNGDAEQLVSNNVPLKFTHPMAAIRFKAGHMGHKVTINSISLSNITSYGTCTYNVGCDTVVWSNNTGNLKTFVQEFNQEIPDEGEYLGDDELTKTFIVIPQKFAANATAEITVKYTDDGVEYAASFPLRMYSWRTNKLYEYTISMPDDIWVDFNCTKVYGGDGFTDINVVFDKSMKYKLAQRDASHEKVNIPFRNLIPGTWYVIDFSEQFEPEFGSWGESDGSHWNGIYGYGAFAVGFFENIQTATDKPSIITLWDGDDELSQYQYFWPISEGVNAYSPSSHVKMCFYATAPTMYWEWDTSKCKDNSSIGDDFYVEYHSINKIVIPTTPAVDYLNATLYGFLHYKSGNQDDTGFSSFKTYAQYGTSSTDGDGNGLGEMEFHGKPQSNKWEKVCIPIVNLEVGSTYTVSFTYKITKATNRPTSSDYFGYSIDDTKINYVNAVSSSPNFIDKSSQMDIGAEYSESVTFTANAQTMYLNWDVSKFENTTVPIVMNFTKTKIVEQ